MNTGFVTFATENYKPIIDNLVESVISFSKHNITVYSVNSEYKHSSLRVRNKKLNISNLSYYNIMKSKIMATIDSEYEYCQVLDGDMIVTKEVDKQFEENSERIKDLEFPLCSKHPNNPFEILREQTYKVLRRYTDKEPKMKYVYASYLFTDNSKWFFKEVLDEMNKVDYMYGDDEMIMNALLAKYEVDYDIGYNYLPNCFEEIVESYLQGTHYQCPGIVDVYKKHAWPVKFYMFHGHKIKDVNYTKTIIEKIQKIK